MSLLAEPKKRNKRQEALEDQVIWYLTGRTYFQLHGWLFLFGDFPEDKSKKNGNWLCMCGKFRKHSTSFFRPSLLWRRPLRFLRLNISCFVKTNFEYTAFKQFCFLPVQNLIASKQLALVLSGAVLENTRKITRKKPTILGVLFRRQG